MSLIEEMSVKCKKITDSCLTTIRTASKLKEEAKKILIFRRQLSLYIDALEEQMLHTKQHLITLHEKYLTAVSEIKNTCRNKKCLPVEEIFVNLFI
jgi:hypothetical protein